MRIYQNSAMLVLYFMEIILLVPDLYRTNLEGGIIKRSLQYIFHIDPGISPRLPYQARQ